MKKAKQPGSGVNTATVTVGCVSLSQEGQPTGEHQVFSFSREDTQRDAKEKKK